LICGTLEAEASEVVVQLPPYEYASGGEARQQGGRSVPINAFVPIWVQAPSGARE
jgi:hypothetical protein